MHVQEEPKPHEPPPPRPGKVPEPEEEPQKQEEPEEEPVHRKLSGVTAAELAQFMLDNDLFS